MPDEPTTAIVVPEQASDIVDVVWCTSAMTAVSVESAVPPTIAACEDEWSAGSWPHDAAARPAAPSANDNIETSR